jgi:FAD/FMN-containing dehydrogenase
LHFLCGSRHITIALPRYIRWRERAMEIAGFLGAVLDADDDGFEAARKIWNGDIQRRPAVIARCTGPADVLAAVRFARERGLPIAIRGAGHAVAGTAIGDHALVIDLSRMTGVRVDPLAGTIRPRAVACGATSITRARPGGWR